MDLQKLKKNNEKKINFFISFLCLVFFLSSTFVNKGLSQANVPELDIDVTEGVVEPIPIAFPNFITRDFSSSLIASEISKIVKNDLLKTNHFLLF